MTTIPAKKGHLQKNLSSPPFHRFSSTMAVNANFKRLMAALDIGGEFKKRAKTLQRS